MSKLHVSQTFYSIQGEGVRTGVLSVWLRLFGCPLRCPGFSQPNPKDPSTYLKPLDFNPKLIQNLNEFPVMEYGCDTLYAIDPKFKHLRRTMEIGEVYSEIVDYLPDNKFYHPKTGNTIDLCITGGEPLLQQQGIADLLDMVVDNVSYVPAIQFETNLLRSVEEPLHNSIVGNNLDVYFNISPKLYSVSGEKYDWSADNLLSMDEIASTSLKIVINETDKAWKELDEKLEKLHKECGNWLPPVYIMPVGSTRKQQTDERVLENITRRAISEGYNISGRLHCLLLGNDINA
jgi:organic radical activating enzyme